MAFAVGLPLDFWGGTCTAGVLIQLLFWQFPWKFLMFWKLGDDVDEEKHELLDCVTVVTVRWPPHPCLVTVTFLVNDITN